MRPRRTAPASRPAPTMADRPFVPQRPDDRPAWRPPFRGPIPNARPAQDHTPPMTSVRLKDGDREIEVSGGPGFVRQILDELPVLLARLRGDPAPTPASIRMPSPVPQPTVANAPAAASVPEAPPASAPTRRVPRDQTPLRPHRAPWSRERRRPTTTPRSRSRCWRRCAARRTRCRSPTSGSASATEAVAGICESGAGFGASGFAACEWEQAASEKPAPTRAAQ